jgi:hypothetical protein
MLRLFFTPQATGCATYFFSRTMNFNHGWARVDTDFWATKKQIFLRDWTCFKTAKGPFMACLVIAHELISNHEYDNRERAKKKARETMAQISGQERLGGHLKRPAGCCSAAHCCCLGGINPGACA